MQSLVGLLLPRWHQPGWMSVVQTACALLWDATSAGGVLHSVATVSAPDFGVVLVLENVLTTPLVTGLYRRHLAIHRTSGVACAVTIKTDFSADHTPLVIVTVKLRTGTGVRTAGSAGASITTGDNAAASTGRCGPTMWEVAAALAFNAPSCVDPAMFLPTASTQHVRAFRYPTFAVQFQACAEKWRRHCGGFDLVAVPVVMLTAGHRGTSSGADACVWVPVFGSPSPTVGAVRAQPLQAGTPPATLFQVAEAVSGWETARLTAMPRLQRLVLNNSIVTPPEAGAQLRMCTAITNMHTVLHRALVLAVRDRMPVRLHVVSRYRHTGKQDFAAFSWGFDMATAVLTATHITVVMVSNSTVPGVVDDGAWLNTSPLRMDALAPRDLLARIAQCLPGVLAAPLCALGADWLNTSWLCSVRPVVCPPQPGAFVPVRAYPARRVKRGRATLYASADTLDEDEDRGTMQVATVATRWLAALPVVAGVLVPQVQPLKLPRVYNTADPR